MRCLAIALALVTACAEGPDHVQLAPFPPNLPPDQRVAAFAQLGPRSMDFVNASGTLTLGNGQTIEAPEDLLPVVGADSATAQAARHSATAQRMSHDWWIGSGLSDVAAGASIFALLSDDHVIRDAGLVVLPASILAAIVTSMLATHYHNVSAEWRRTAFENYAHDLGDELKLCAHGLQVVPCAGF